MSQQECTDSPEHKHSMDVDEDSNQTFDTKLSWILQYGCLKESFVHMG